MNFSCPKCGRKLQEADLRAQDPVCPKCKSKLHAGLQSEWMYSLLALAVGSILALLQQRNVATILFALLYAAILLVLVKTLRWKLHLPLNVVVIPKYRFWSGARDKSGDDVQSPRDS